jgi:putative ABC transport system ATP-binding protein
MIEVKHLFKTFKSGDEAVYAVDNVSFFVPAGQFVSVTGKSGSGKSTLLYQLGLLDHPTNGEVWIDGKPTTHLSSDERTMLRLQTLGYIFQDYAILPSLSALENVMVPLLMLGATEAEATIKATEALTEVGLGDRLHNLPSQLSGGQQQRVAIARAIGHNPKIIFADEPTANLDSDTSRSVLDTFLMLNKRGQTIVMVTHESEYAALTHRTITLADGKLIGDTLNTG